ncbi:TTR-39 protein, partial [Aphelenchoides avenae]
SDDLMGYTKSGTNGTFQLIAAKAQLLRVDPVLKIYHDCKNEDQKCKRKLKFKVSKDYVTEGTHVAKWFDLGALDLEPKKADEEKKCF